MIISSLSNVNPTNSEIVWSKYMAMNCPNIYSEIVLSKLQIYIHIRRLDRQAKLMQWIITAFMCNNYSHMGVGPIKFNYLHFPKKKKSQN